jgi:hypothetical protein
MTKAIDEAFDVEREEPPICSLCHEAIDKFAASIRPPAPPERGAHIEGGE